MWFSIFIPSFFPHTWSFPWCSLICQNTPLSLLPPPSSLSVCLSLSSSPASVWYDACMHHGPANKLHRVATPLPLSLSCQVEPLKHSPFSPLHCHPSIHPSISPSSLPPPGTLLRLLTLMLPTPISYTCSAHQDCRSDLFPLSSYPFIYPSIPHYFISPSAQLFTSQGSIFSLLKHTILIPIYKMFHLLRKLCCLLS